MEVFSPPSSPCRVAAAISAIAFSAAVFVVASFIVYHFVVPRFPASASVAAFLVFLASLTSFDRS